MVMEFELPVQPAQPPPCPDVLQPQPELLDPPPHLPPALQPAEAAEMLEAVERMLRVDREETQKMVQVNKVLFGRKMEAELGVFGQCLDRAENKITTHEVVSNILKYRAGI